MMIAYFMGYPGSGQQSVDSDQKKLIADRFNP
jgi:hypothetical protein